MSIIFKCDCGRELVAADTMAGKEIRCGLCGATHIVPDKSETKAPVDTTPVPEPHQDSTPPPQQATPPPPPPPPFGWQVSAPQYNPYRPASPYLPFARQPIMRPQGPTGTLPVMLALVGICGHLMDCIFSVFTGVIFTGFSIAAVLTGIFAAKNARYPRAIVNARLGAVLGIFGAAAGILYIASILAAETTIFYIAQAKSPPQRDRLSYHYTKDR